MAKQRKKVRRAEVPLDLVGVVSAQAINVWCALHGCADRSTGVCFPAMGTLAKRLRVNATTVGRAVKELENTGRLEVNRKGRRVTSYRLVLDDDASAQVQEVSAQVQGVSAQVQEGICVDADASAQVQEVSAQVQTPIEVVNQNHLTKTNEPPPASAGGERPVGQKTLIPDPDPEPPKEPPAPSFDDWYQHYPRKVSRRAAEKAWKKLSADNKRKALAAVTGFKAATDSWPKDRRRFIPYPASWLNGGRYDDDPAEWRDSSGHQERAQVSAKYSRGMDYYTNQKGTP